jgi:ribonuclease R
VIDKNRKGFAFLVFDSKQREDVFLPPERAREFFHGDRVEVGLDSRGRVLEVSVLAHRFRELVGRYFPGRPGRGGGARVVYERKRAREEVYCPKGHPDAKAGDWVRCRLEFGDQTEDLAGADAAGVVGTVVEVFGADIPPRADVAMVAAEYSLEEEHSAQAEREASSFRLDVGRALREGRTDLRSVPFITIDGVTARDFDDAVFVEKEGDGFVLWVAIADVSHYVSPATALDEEARSRGTSVYFPERAFHMLPRALSENLCSLRPNEPRLAMVARMAFDRSGQRRSTELLEALIESRRRATYEEIQAEWESNRDKPSWEFSPHFQLYQLIRKARSARGSIDFDLPEAEMRVLPTGEVESIRIRERLDSHRLIEEFMIAANEAVTAWMLERRWPFVYRTHDEPSDQALERFRTLAWHVGVEVKLGKGPLHRQLADVLEQVEGHPAQTLLNTAMLRSMKQAVYSSLHQGHFGLASPGYTHFTSPIRRYPDLVVHRLLRAALHEERGQKGKLDRVAKQRLEAELEEICEHCSYRERIAADAERESIKLKQVRAMIPRLGEELDGRVIGMIEAGFFVQVSEPYVEGMVGRDSLRDDFYRFDEERLVFSGRRRNRTFRIGDRVRVQVAKAEIETRTIDFELVSHEPSPGSAAPVGGGPKGRGRGRSGRARDEKPGHGGGPSGKRGGRRDRGRRR